MLFLDLDGFKTINDTLGHDAGDQLLRMVAQRIDGVARSPDGIGDIEGRLPRDAVFRFGGDEFVVLLSSLPERSTAGGVAQRILDALRQPIVLGDQEIFTGASIGITVHPEDGVVEATLVSRADIAMYDAKARGRNNFQFYDASIAGPASRRLELGGRLRRAVEEGAFEIVYQPLCRAGDVSVVGVEALLRWTDPKLGVIPPSEFIPIAEESGEIAPLGAWVLRHATRQLRAWDEAGLRVSRLCVNVSAQQVRHPSIVDRFATCCRHRASPPSGWSSRSRRAPFWGTTA